MKTCIMNARSMMCFILWLSIVASKKDSSSYLDLIKKRVQMVKERVRREKTTAIDLRRVSIIWSMRCNTSIRKHTNLSAFLISLCFFASLCAQMRHYCLWILFDWIFLTFLYFFRPIFIAIRRTRKRAPAIQLSVHRRQSVAIVPALKIRLETQTRLMGLGRSVLAGTGRTVSTI